jgi:outer membrane protein
MLLETESTANGRAVLDTVGTGGNYSIDADDSVGLTFQAGVDINLSERLMFNAAIWKMDIGTTIEVANSLRVDLEIDPWVYMLGFGYKF